MVDNLSPAYDEEQPVLNDRSQEMNPGAVAASKSKMYWTALEVPIWIENPSDQNSDRQPVTLGVPLPRGRVFAPCYASLQPTAESNSSRAQCNPLAFWSDGSIRWLLLDFIVPANAPGKSNARVMLSPTEPPQENLSGITALKTYSEVHELVSGQHCFRVEGTGSIPIRSGSAFVADQFECRFQLTDSRGQSHLAEFSSLEPEVIGPVRSSFLLKGTLPVAIDLECRLRFTIFAESGLARIQATLHNPRRAHHQGGLWDLGDAGSIQLQSWVLKLSMPPSDTAHSQAPVAWQTEPDTESPKIGQDVFIYQDSSGGENWRSPVHMNRSGRVPCQFRGYRAKSGQSTATGLRANPTVALRQGNLTVSVSVPEFWQQFPLSLQANSSGIDVGLFPGKWSDQFELQGGEQKTHTVWMQLSDASEGSESLAESVKRLSKIVHSPARAGCMPEWYAEAEALPFLVSTGSAELQPTGQQILSEAVAGDQSLFAKRETIDEYGWRNYGDVWADHEKAHFEGSGPVISHYNNQFDMIAGGLRQFMQSGNSAWWQFAAPLARHVIDIDIYHTTQDRAAYNGGLFWFTDHYFSAATSTHRTYSRHNAPLGAGPQNRSSYGGGPGSEHNFATGLLYYYWMTGEPDAAEAVRTLADWVIAMDDGRQNFLGLLDDGPTGLASMSTELEYQGPGRGAANSMQVLLDAWLLTSKGEYLAKCEAILHRVIHPDDDIASHSLLDAEHRWSYTMFLMALVRYLDIMNEVGLENHSRAYARASLLAYARWMADHERRYLDHPEALQFPTEAWAAQELRKANVLRLAARFETDPGQADKMRRRGEELADRAWSDLAAFPTRHNARTVAIVMTEGPIDGYLRANCETSLPDPTSTNYNFGKPQSFVPQKLRIKNASRKPLGILQLLLAALRPPAWLRLARIYNSRRVRK